MLETLNVRQVLLYTCAKGIQSSVSIGRLCDSWITHARRYPSEKQPEILSLAKQIEKKFNKLQMRFLYGIMEDSPTAFFMRESTDKKLYNLCENLIQDANIIMGIRLDPYSRLVSLKDQELLAFERYQLQQVFNRFYENFKELQKFCKKKWNISVLKS